MDNIVSLETISRNIAELQDRASDEVALNDKARDELIATLNAAKTAVDGAIKAVTEHFGDRAKSLQSIMRGEDVKQAAE